MTFCHRTFILIAALSWSFAFTAEAKTYLSAKRPSHLSFAQISSFLDVGTEARLSPSGSNANDPEDAYSSRQSGKDFREKKSKLKVVTWPAEKSFEKAFQKVRDSRILKEDVDFPRRPTWLYPDDGCFARAEVTSKELQGLGYPAPSKIFAFGDLKAKTKEHPAGFITWWYHVVVGYRVGNEVLVIDPSIDARKPMKLEDWIQAMGGRVDLSVCQASAIDPDSKCLSEPPISKNDALELQSPFLSEEWKRLSGLGRNPTKELGEEPPWLTPNH